MLLVHLPSNANVCVLLDTTFAENGTLQILENGISCERVHH